jgi:hypothetical protein
MKILKIICVFIAMVFVFVGYSYAESSYYFFGFTQIRTSFFQSNTEDLYSQLEINKLRTGFDVNITKKIGFCFVVEGGKVSPMKSYHFSLLDSYVRFNLSDLINIRIGRDWYKFGWEYTQPIPTLPFINFSETVSTIFDTMGRNGFYGYDTGLWINGNSNNKEFNFGYNFSLTQGTGLNNKEDNNLKDISLRVFIEPNKNLHFGVSLFKGYSKIEKGNLKDFILDIEFRINYNKIIIGTEYIYSISEENRNNKIQYPEQTKNGFYSYINYLLNNKISLLFRYEYNNSLFIKGEKRKLITVGVNYKIKKLTNLKINYINKNIQNSNYNELLMQYQVFFDWSRD